ncbi:WD40/YVTN/BNR-like repeat-containing protein [Chryseobacterium sp. CT-SW4]|uniref:WD40/YVTN/BNR-like repeat-containing protein n=1 Tax=Chryseobacterium sp. SW-1 TaxID=3157343 RepID=UPI003B02A00E
MKKTLSLLALLSGLSIFSQQVKNIQTILDDKISIRSLEVYDGKVWYTGTDSKLGFVDLKNPKQQTQIRLSDEKLQFRTLGQDKTSFYTINIESPAYFFAIDKKSLKSNVVFTDTARSAFYDALHFVNNDLAYAFSDPGEDHIVKLAVFRKGKWSRFKNNVQLNEGEAAFAASNTNIASSGQYMWIATGGKSSRIIRLNLKNEQIEVFRTPFIQGESSQGIYSLDFYDDRFGIAVGGDYTRQSENINNIAVTHDGGESWEIQASGKNAGYMTCVKIRPGSEGKEIMAVGDQHISYSSDFGKTWTKISEEKDMYVCQWINSTTVVLAGKNRIALLELKF